MDLKELGVAMSEALALRGVIDSLDEKLSSADAQIDSNKLEISRLDSLQKVTEEAESDRKALSVEREKRNSELVERLTLLEEVGAKLPIQQKFSSSRVSL